jgi:hypothetical protein
VAALALAQEPDKGRHGWVGRPRVWPLHALDQRWPGQSRASSRKPRLVCSRPVRTWGRGGGPRPLPYSSRPPGPRVAAATRHGTGRSGTAPAATRPCRPPRRCPPLPPAGSCPGLGRSTHPALDDLALGELHNLPAAAGAGRLEVGLGLFGHFDEMGQGSALLEFTCCLITCCLTAAPLRSCQRPPRRGTGHSAPRRRRGNGSWGHGFGSSARCAVPMIGSSGLRSEPLMVGGFTPGGGGMPGPS